LDKKGQFILHMLKYPIRRVKPEGGNVSDQEITLVFDKQGRLVEIDYNAMHPLSGEIIFQDTVPGTKTKFFFTKPPLPQQSQ